MLSVVTDDGATQSGSLIDEIVREGARRMLAAALEADVNQYMAEPAAETDEAGRRLVVRNGHHRPRTVATAAGAVEVKAPRVNDRRVDEATGERQRFSWADLLRDGRRRGMRDPEPVVGDGAMGWPGRRGRCADPPAASTRGPGARTEVPSGRPVRSDQWRRLRRCTPPSTVPT